MQRLIHPPEVELVEERFGERVRVVLAVAEERLTAVRELAAALALTIEVGLAIEAGPTIEAG